jgi:hypothetical protein
LDLLSLVALFELFPVVVEDQTESIRMLSPGRQDVDQSQSFTLFLLGEIGLDRGCLALMELSDISQHN